MVDGAGAAAATVTTLTEVLLPMAAVMLAVPRLSPVTSPLVPGRLLTEATPGALELQVADAVRSWTEVLPVKVPAAVNWRAEPRAMLGFVGVTDKLASVFAVSEVEPTTGVLPPSAALMTVVPAALAGAVAIPCDPAVLLMVATPGTEEFQVTRLVKSLVPSGKVPVAVKGSVTPAAMLWLGGVTVISEGACTTTLAVPAGVPGKAALMVVAVAAGARARASPLLSMETLAVLLELQETSELTSRVVPFDKLPLAVNR